ncbi:hypothetical protein [Synechococcus elongatus]|uniref:hypothetical protein n=1 Tax=Synechococcus elongatus TaxID=32046 RepID=UPI0030CB99B6
MAGSQRLLSDRPLQGSALRRAWVVGTLAACLLSGTIGTLWIVIRFNLQPFGGLPFSPAPAVCEVWGPVFCQVVGLSEEVAIAFGFPIALIQLYLLRHWVSSRWLWLFFTVLFWKAALSALPLLTYGLFASTLSTVVGSALLIASGSLLGYTQGALLRSHLNEWREWWMLQTVIAIAAVLLWSLTAPLLSVIGSISIPLFALAIVLLYALLSGNLLTKLRSNPVAETV